MKSIRNFFPTTKCVDGDFKIVGGAISLPFISDGQYFLIENSLLNDGVYRYPVSDLTDEEFNGFITLLNPPKDFLLLAKEIEEYTANNKLSGFQSESFGGYSYTKATKSDGSPADWQDVFQERLNVWRKV